VRRNKLSDFAQVNRAGKIAMRLDDGEGIVDVQICSEADDVLLTTANGQCIRFPVTEVRVFKGRDSMGVRGIALGPGERVISLAILRHIEADSGERLAYLKMRRAVAGDVSLEANGEAAGEEGGIEDTPVASNLGPDRYAEMSAAEQIILTVSANGYGKRTSSYEYRITGRGGKGIVAMAVNQRNGKLIASMAVEDGDEIVLVTNGGQLIRCPVDGIRVAGRGTQGVIVFDTDAAEQVVAVERITEEDTPRGDDEEPRETGQGEEEGR
jgi:DNA gyrase subunit A